MSAEPSFFRTLLERPVVVRPLVRILLALTVMAGGLALAGVGVLVFFSKPAGTYPSPVGVAVLSVAMVAAGVCFLWVALRLFRAHSTRSNVLSPSARRRSSLVVGGLAVGMLAVAFEKRSALGLAAAALLLVFSYFLFPLAEH